MGLPSQLRILALFGCCSDPAQRTMHISYTHAQNTQVYYTQGKTFPLSRRKYKNKGNGVIGKKQWLSTCWETHGTINTVYDSLCGFRIDWSSHGCGVCMEWYNYVCVLVYACECICEFVYVHMEWYVCVWVVCVHMEWCAYVWSGVCAYIWSGVHAYELCVCIWSGVYAYRGCVCIWSGVYAYGGCVCAYGVMCVYASSGQNWSFLMFWRHCSFLSGHWLILCAAFVGTAEPFPSYQAGWQHCLGSTSVAMCVVLGGRWGLMISSSSRQPLGRHVPYLPVRVLPALSQAFGSPDRPVCCGGCSFQWSPGTHLPFR